MTDWSCSDTVQQGSLGKKKDSSVSSKTNTDIFAPIPYAGTLLTLSGSTVLIRADSTLKGCTKLSQAVLDRDRPALLSVLSKKKHDVNEADKHGRSGISIRAHLIDGLQHCLALRLC
jgi:hypothetical protein